METEGWEVRLGCSTSLADRSLWVGTCSNLQYPWITFVVLSNFYHFCQLVLSTNPLLFYHLFQSYQTCVIFSPHCYLPTFYVIYAPYLCTCSTHQKHNSLSRLYERTSSAPIHFPTQQASLAIVPFWHGGSRHGWEVSSRTNQSLQTHGLSQPRRRY